ncbi:MAG: hypothetical protein EB164_09110, partial [Thaumarchaeota archaeon]|nr:hypothetical protein [Nitrososphaerota archaeon]
DGTSVLTGFIGSNVAGEYRVVKSGYGATEVLANLHVNVLNASNITGATVTGNIVNGTSSVNVAASGNVTLFAAGNAVSVPVNKKALSITANADTKTYGQTKTYGSGSTAFTSSGLANSETIGSVTITDTNSGGVATASVSGTYVLTPSAATGGTFNANNYRIGNATFTAYEIPNEFEYTNFVKKGQTFISVCAGESTVAFLKYIGIVQDSESYYYLFFHGNAILPQGLTCKYPQIIQHGFAVDFNLNENTIPYKRFLFNGTIYNDASMVATVVHPCKVLECKS